MSVSSNSCNFLFAVNACTEQILISCIFSFAGSESQLYSRVPQKKITKKLHGMTFFSVLAFTTNKLHDMTIFLYLHLPPKISRSYYKNNTPLGSQPAHLWAIADFLPCSEALGTPYGRGYAPPPPPPCPTNTSVRTVFFWDLINSVLN